MTLTTPPGPAMPVVTPHTTRRRLGAYYTPESVADYLADLIVRRPGDHVLEPSFGDGTLLRAVIRSAGRRRLAARLSGVEFDRSTVERLSHDSELADAEMRCEDFLAVSPFPVQAVIGNPPYVRLRHVSAAQRERALAVAGAALGQAMDPSGSLWMPFVLHAMRFLEPGGRLALVLPYDFTYVRYARPLWAKLGGSFGSLEVLRSHERLFPDLLQDVVILLADGFGSRTSTVRYRAFDRVRDLLQDDAGIDEALDLEGVVRGERTFVSALLGRDLRDLLEGPVAAATTPARRQVTFNIGYVAGDKRFFHPTEAAAAEYRIPPGSLRPSLTSARALKGAGLRTSSLEEGRASRLFFPDPGALTAGERDYVAWGEATGVSSRYKCRIRDPWYIVPGTRVPDVVLTVFSENPVLLINEAGYLASNSLLCGYRTHATSGEIAAGWYTSLTLLQCELEVHALGGGVMVMVPREAGSIRIPGQVRAEPAHLHRLDGLLRQGEIAEAYRAGDEEVLIRQLGFTADAVDLIRQGTEVLAHWRTSARSSLEGPARASGSLVKRIALRR